MRSNGNARYDGLEARVARAEERLRSQAERLRRQNDRLQRQQKLIDEIRPTANRAHALFEILGSQLGSIEERLQQLTEKVELGRYDATEVERTEARTLLEEVRDEHRRVRVRFGAVTGYEERIRRLESALADEMAAATALAQEAAAAGLVADAPEHGAVRLPDEDEPPAT